MTPGGETVNRSPDDANTDCMILPLKMTAINYDDLICHNRSTS